ncbi:hypothetical protein PQR37_30285 [Paraburkholderia nemoris]|uniref:hypothetical protein n=1 Tax=Paraburkholderia nemoris TaxID=2793076 RepID=UPI0038BB5ED7
MKVTIAAGWLMASAEAEGVRKQVVERYRNADPSDRLGIFEHCAPITPNGLD